jgi:transcriptional regulator with XRE-family HTH domain
MVSVKLRNHEDLGRFLRSRRAELGLTQTDLAERAGVRRATVVAVERGQTHPTFATALALLDAMEVSLVTRLPAPPVSPSDVVLTRRPRRRVNLADVLAQAQAPADAGLFDA